MKYDIMKKFPFQIQNFVYDGFAVHPKEGFASYRASFKEWTNDPGIAKCDCSDGKERLIPSCQLKSEENIQLAKQIYKKATGGKVIIGAPSHS